MADLSPHEPADPTALSRSVETAKRQDATAANEALRADAAPMGLAGSDPLEGYKRSLRRVLRACLVGVSIGVGRLWRPELGSALADAVDEPSGELADLAAELLQGKFRATLGFLGFAAAWGESALKLEIAALHKRASEPPKRPENVVPINQPPAVTERTAAT